jgi:hypothetical protein
MALKPINPDKIRKPLKIILPRLAQLFSLSSSFCQNWRSFFTKQVFFAKIGANEFF